VAVVLSIGLMAVDQRFHHLQSLRSALAVITYPLHVLADLPVTATRWIGEAFATRESLATEVADLREENLKLRARLQKFEAIQAENMRLRDLLESSFKVGDRVLVAELSSVDLDPYKQQVVVDKGSTSGVFEGQPVLDANGVMGQVTHVSPYRATVLLVTDASHALPVQVLRNGLRTIAVGGGRVNQLDLPYLPNDADIREDDLLVTSGLGGKFPPGYPVARVARVQRTPDRPFAEVSAEPRAHLDRTREVLLVWTVNPPPIAEAAAPGGGPPEGP
jgi:rod shape-determining protein MreC